MMKTVAVNKSLIKKIQKERSDQVKHIAREISRKIPMPPKNRFSPLSDFHSVSPLDRSRSIVNHADFLLKD